MIVRLPAFLSSMALEITRATSTYELYALRRMSAFSRHVTGIAGSVCHVRWLAEQRNLRLYDDFGYTIVSLQMDSRNNAGMMFYSP